MAGVIVRASLADNGTAPGRRVLFRCRGCGNAHQVVVDVPDGGWSWNGNLERPSFSPSVLVHEIRRDDGSLYAPRCHSFVTDGRIEYLPDSTHSLAGQTVDLPPWGER